MGCWTNYTLKTDPPEAMNDVLDGLGDLVGLVDVRLIVDAVGWDGKGYEKWEWYDHEDDVRRLSIKFPQVRFTLHGEGEKAGDIWDKHFLDGRIQECRPDLTIPPFDPLKLDGRYREPNP